MLDGWYLLQGLFSQLLFFVSFFFFLGVMNLVFTTHSAQIFFPCLPVVSFLLQQELNQDQNTSKTVKCSWMNEEKEQSAVIGLNLNFFDLFCCFVKEKPGPDFSLLDRAGLALFPSFHA